MEAKAGKERRRKPTTPALEQKTQQAHASQNSWQNQKKQVEDAGIDPATSRMLSERSTI
jgi:hypothetical protein